MVVTLLAIVVIGALFIAGVSVQNARQRRRDEREADLVDRQHRLMDDLARSPEADEPHAPQLPHLDTGQQILDDLEQIQDEAS